MAEVQVVPEPLLEMVMVLGWNPSADQQDTIALRQIYRYGTHRMLSSFPDMTRFPVLSR